MNKKYIIGFLVVLLIVAGTTYRLGVNFTKNAFSQGLTSTQAMLAFNHLKRYEEVYRCLSNGRHEEATLKVKMSIISEKELISELFKNSNDPELTKYIDLRYPDGAENLRNFTSNRGSQWTEPSCK